MATILINAAFGDVVLSSGGEVLIRGRCLFQYGYPKVQCLFEARHLLGNTVLDLFHLKVAIEIL